MKGLVVSIYTDAIYRETRETTAPGKDSGCCHVFGGVSQIVLVGPEFPEVFEASEVRPAAKLVRRHLFGKDVFHIEPVNPPQGQFVGPMAGGAYVASSDSRFVDAIGGAYVAIPLHDRFETPRTYNSLFD